MRAALRIIAVVVVSVFVAWLLATLLSALSDIEQSQDDRADLRSLITEQQDTIDRLKGQVVDLGGVPVDAGPLPSDPIVIPGVRGEPGPPGRDGRDGESIVGEPGRDGSDGESITGAPGGQGPPGESIVGPQGERGPMGGQGDRGPAGGDGRGVESIECTDDGWVVTYTTGETHNAGDCRPVLIDP